MFVCCQSFLFCAEKRKPAVIPKSIPPKIYSKPIAESVGRMRENGATDKNVIAARYLDTKEGKVHKKSHLHYNYSEKWYFKRRNNKMSFVVYIVIGCYYFVASSDICRCIYSVRNLMFYSFYCLYFTLYPGIVCYLFLLHILAQFIGVCGVSECERERERFFLLAHPIIFQRIDKILCRNMQCFLLLISFLSSDNWQVFIRYPLILYLFRAPHIYIHLDLLFLAV